MYANKWLLFNKNGNLKLLEINKNVIILMKDLQLNQISALNDS